MHKYLITDGNKCYRRKAQGARRVFSGETDPGRCWGVRMAMRPWLVGRSQAPSPAAVCSCSVGARAAAWLWLPSTSCPGRDPSAHGLCWGQHVPPPRGPKLLLFFKNRPPCLVADAGPVASLPGCVLANTGQRGGGGGAPQIPLLKAPAPLGLTWVSGPLLRGALPARRCGPPLGRARCGVSTAPGRGPCLCGASVPAGPPGLLPPPGLAALAPRGEQVPTASNSSGAL